MALGALLVIAAVVVCIIVIAKGSGDGDGADTTHDSVTAESQTDTDDASPYKPVDTDIVTDEPEGDKAPDTDVPDTNVSPDTGNGAPDTTGETPDTSKSVTPADTDDPAPANAGTDLGEGLILLSVEPYSGAFVEDGSDENVEDIISIVVKNAGDSAVQMVNISLETGYGTAEFTATTLLPNTSTVVLEKNRMKYPGADRFGTAKIELLGRFIEEPSFYSDMFEVKGADGYISVTNKSGSDVTENVRVYYKTVKDGRYFGGITYQATLNGGISAGNTILLNTSHFRINDSRLVFVKYE